MVSRRKYRGVYIAVELEPLTQLGDLINAPVQMNSHVTENRH